MTNRNLYQEITSTIVEMLQTHLQNWDMPWIANYQTGSLAFNAISKNRYQGINQLLLSFSLAKNNFTQNAWLSFKQIEKNGGKVIKGCKSTTVVYWSTLYYQGDTLIQEDLVKLMSAQEFDSRGIKKVTVLRNYPVFNIAQTQGLPQELYQTSEIANVSPLQMDERAETFLLSTGAKVLFNNQNQAYYNPAKDMIILPYRSQFKSKESFYDTILHEIGHWTGHPERLNRDLHNKFGTFEYALEELVAELFCAFASSTLGFDKRITNNAAYIKNWIHAMNNDPKYIFKASRLAENAIKYLESKGAFENPIVET